MPFLLPFRGYRYNPGKVALQDVVAPPYDVISPDLQQRLYEREPHNVVRLILGREADRYRSAAEHLRRWQQDHILLRDAQPSLYVLHQTFDGPDGTTRIRKGFIALCRLEEFDKGIVLPHEKTLSRPREDRFKLIKATNANFSQILALYSDPGKAIDRALNGIAKTEPLVDVVYEDVQSRLWSVTDPHTVAAVQREMQEKQVLIADGHHRYETALAYREYRRSQAAAPTGSEPYDYVMMYFTNVDDENLVIFPTHRVVHSLPAFDKSDFLKRTEQYFIRREFKERQALMVALEASSVPSFGVLFPGDPTANLLSVKPSISLRELVRDPFPDEVKVLDVTILHSVLLKEILGISWEAQEEKRNLEYIRDPNEVSEVLQNGTAQLAFLVNATKIQQVRAVAKAGHTMPQKSTYFYPKLLSGLVIRTLEE